MQLTQLIREFLYVRFLLLQHQLPAFCFFHCPAYLSLCRCLAPPAGPLPSAHPTPLLLNYARPRAACKELCTSTQSPSRESRYRPSGSVAVHPAWRVGMMPFLWQRERCRVKNTACPAAVTIHPPPREKSDALQLL